MSEVWLILGATSSIASAFAHEVAASGAGVVLAGRDREELERQAADLRIRHGIPTRTLAFDAEDVARHGELAEAMEGGGRVNVFAAFGFMPLQADSEADPPLALRVISVNFAGMVSAMLHLAPLLERQGGGKVVVLGSVAGDRGRRSNHIYGSAKAGLHTFLQGFRARMLRAGVSVITIKPGFTDTAMTWGVPGMFLVASPRDMARRCLELVGKGVDEAYVPGFWRIIMTIIRAIPERLFKRLDI